VHKVGVAMLFEILGEHPSPGWCDFDGSSAWSMIARLFAAVSPCWSPDRRGEQRMCRRGSRSLLIAPFERVDTPVRFYCRSAAALAPYRVPWRATSTRPARPTPQLGQREAAGSGAGVAPEGAAGRRLQETDAPDSAGQGALLHGPRRRSASNLAPLGRAHRFGELATARGPLALSSSAEMMRSHHFSELADPQPRGPRSARPDRACARGRGSAAAT
jgi:hypothetical protein